jgi:hypothetical protein
MSQLSYEVREAVKQRQIGSTEFRIHTWFDHTRNTMVVEVLAADDASQPDGRGKTAVTSR